MTLIVPIPFCLTRGIALTTKQKLSGKGWLPPPHTGDCLTQLTRMSSAKVQLQEQPPMTSHKLSCDRILPNKIKFIYLRFNLILHLTQRLLVYSYSCTTMPTVQVKNISIIPPPQKNYYHHWLPLLGPISPQSQSRLICLLPLQICPFWTSIYMELSGHDPWHHKSKNLNKHNGRE